MDEKDQIKKFGLSNDDVERLAAQYEAGDVTFGDGDQVLAGSSLDFVGTRRESFLIDAADMQKVRALAKQQRSKSEIYRDSIRQYLTAAGL